MTDDRPYINRRTVLGAIGTVGTGSVLGGTGAMAYLNDTESVTSTVAAGNLDLKVRWEEHYNGEKVQTQGLTNEYGPMFELGDIKPCDHGEATIGLHLYDNPGYVWMRGNLTTNSDGEDTEPEAEVDETEEGDLVKNIWARVWYDGAGGDGGNNEYEDGEVQIAAGRLDEVLDELSDGIMLENQKGDAVTVSSDSDSCEQLGEKFEGQPQVGDTVGPNDEFEVTAVHKEDNEVVGFDWESDVPICLVDIKAGKGSQNDPESHEYTSYDCETSGTAYAPEHTNNPNRTWYAISNFQVKKCTTDGGDGGDGGDDAWPPSTTQYLGFEWVLPCHVGNEIQGDVAAFNLEFYAEQERHNPDPTNPWD